MVSIKSRWTTAVRFWSFLPCYLQVSFCGVAWSCVVSRGVACFRVVSRGVAWSVCQCTTCYIAPHASRPASSSLFMPCMRRIFCQQGFRVHAKARAKHVVLWLVNYVLANPNPPNFCRIPCCFFPPVPKRLTRHHQPSWQPEDDSLSC